MKRCGQAKWLWGAILAAVSALPSLAGAQALAGDAAAEIVVRALGQLDVPYRYGGRTPAGFDCSGLVGFIFSEAIGVALPRRSEEIGRVGESLNRGDLVPGDLVFFNTLGHRFSHVGIYIGEGQFVHAPAGRGRVRVERLADRYWTVRYNGARRVPGLPLAEASVAGATSGAAVAIEAAPERVTP